MTYLAPSGHADSPQKNQTNKKPPHSPRKSSGQATPPRLPHPKEGLESGDLADHREA